MSRPEATIRAEKDEGFVGWNSEIIRSYPPPFRHLIAPPHERARASLIGESFSGRKVSTYIAPLGGKTPSGQGNTGRASEPPAQSNLFWGTITSTSCPFSISLLTVSPATREALETLGR